MNPPGPRMISITPVPRSYRVAFAPGKARPWSVVQMIRVRSASPVECRPLRTAPIPWSSERALALNAAMSWRVCEVSGRFGGGSEYSVSRTEVGAANERCVSKKPTEAKNGSSARARTSSAFGAISFACVLSTGITSS